MKNNRGFSLIELIVSVAIMSIVMVIATTMLVNGSRFFERQSVQIELQNEAQIVTNYLTQSIMEATAMNFHVTDTTDGSGVYELYSKDEDTGALTGKDEQRILYYDGANTSLYMISFDTADAVPDASLYSSIGYLISDHVTEFKLEFKKGEVTDPQVTTTTAADGTTQPAEIAVRNPVQVDIKFKLSRSNVSYDFEVKADCRNHLEKVIYKEEADETVVYKAYDR